MSQICLRLPVAGRDSDNLALLGGDNLFHLENIVAETEGVGVEVEVALGRGIVTSAVLTPLNRLVWGCRLAEGGVANIVICW